jgi:hypothetical protein
MGPSVDPSFAATAGYFEKRAERARDNNERRRLLEVAEFYRSLANVVPSLPSGFKLNGRTPANLREQRWEARAEACRMLAEQFNDPHCRQQLARLAATYDQLALQRQFD